MSTHDMSAGLPAEAYDRIAARYDLTTGKNPINQWMRDATTSWLLRSFRPGGYVLEIGCGTGDDALLLAQSGVRVLACDPAPRMVESARTKVRKRGLAGHVEVRQLGATQLDILIAMVGERAFDGAFSHFALTYVPSLERVASDLAALLKPGAIFLSSTRNRLCALDLMAHVLALRPGRARARLRSTGSFEVGGATVPIRNYALGELRRVFGPFFALEECRGLAVFLPPAEWAPLYGRARPVTGLLQTADAAMRDKWPFKLLGDHVLLRWKRLSHDVLGPSP